MLTDKQIAQLSVAFPGEALTEDRSRGFVLTSIKAAYIIERLNEVFGLLGYGWRYAHSPTTRDGKEVLMQVVLQYRCEESGEAALRWDRTSEDWQSVNGDAGWSAPIFAYGGNQIGGGGTPVLDAMKSAVTAGITKAASRLGVALAVHKGLRRPGQDSTEGHGGERPEAEQASGGGNGHLPAWEWKSYWETFSEDQMDVEKATKAGAVELWFGKHQGKSLAEIDQEDKGYLMFLSERFNPQGDDRKTKLKNAAIYRRACRKFAQAQQEEAVEAERLALNL